MEPSHVRSELIAIVAELTGDLMPSVTPIGSAFLETSVFFLEEAEIDRYLSAAIGKWLRNGKEAAALNALALPLKSVLQEGGGWPAAEDVLYQHTPSWPELQDASAEALRVLRQPDELTRSCASVGQCDPDGERERRFYARYTRALKTVA